MVIETIKCTMIAIGSFIIGQKLSDPLVGAAIGLLFLSIMPERNKE
jgi:hypothetical protein